MSGKTAELIGELAGVSRSSAQKFFKGKPISVENFQALCEVLELHWEEIAEPEEIASSVKARKRVAFVIEGSLDDLDPTKLAKLQAMVRALQQLTGDASITTVEIEEGSIRLVLEGSEEGIEKLKQLFNEGELAEVLGTPVRAVESIEFDALDVGEVREDRLKALLISTIQSHGALRSDLSGADLSGTDLSGADLSNSIIRYLDHDLARDLADQIDLARDLADQIDLARDLADQIDLARDLADQIDLARDLADQIDLARDRASQLSRNLELARYHARCRYRYRDPALARYRDYTLNLALDIARYRAHALDLVRTLDLDLAHALSFDLARASDHYHAIARALSRYRARYCTSANFSGANFSGANFSGADFSGANFSGADFSGANFSGANFSGANFSGAIVENAYFGEGIGLTESEKLDLKQRGAIFDESTGDREFVLFVLR